MIGVMTNKEALERAQQEGLDLIEIAPNATPPVCKIMDFGKYKYQIAKKEKEARKKQHTVKLKEIKLRPKTDDHDYAYKVQHAREFLEEGDRVKITIVFRGREMAHLEFGNALVQRVKTDLADLATAEIEDRMIGKRMTCLFIPIPNKIKAQKKDKKEESPSSKESPKPHPVAAAHQEAKPVA